MNKYDLPIRLPVGVEGKHCAEHLIEFLSTHPGVVSAAIDQASSTLRMKYDAEQLSLTEVQSIARSLGAEIGRQFHHCQMHMGKPRCRDCTKLLETDLQKIDGVSRVTANPAASSIVVEYDSDNITPAQIERRVYRLGYRVGTTEASTWTPWQRWREALLTVFCGLCILAGIFSDKFIAARGVHLLFFILAYLAGGYEGTIAAARALRNKIFDVNFLMVAAALGAATIDQWQEGAILLFLFSLSGTLETFAMGKTRRAIRALMDLKPQEALVKTARGEERLPVETLEVNDLIIVKPGERIAADGVVLRGASAVDQAAITGESMPVEKNIGSEVFAGTVNHGGSLEVRVTRQAGDTTLAKIIKLVEEAQSEKAPMQRLIDNFGAWYVPAVVIATILMATVPAFIFDKPFADYFYRAMVLLVVASPCALVISTPATILSAIANGARNGILFKGGLHLENAAHIKVVAFDKTGTLTTGRPRVAEVIGLSGATENDVLVLAASIERLSSHPIAHAIVNEAAQRQLKLLEASDLQVIAGAGVRARLDGQNYFVGNLKLFDNGEWPVDQSVRDQVEAFEQQGKITVVVGNRRMIGIITVADMPRQRAYSIVDELRAVGVKKVAMLTGDRQAVADTVAAQLRIDESLAELLPEDKVRVIRKLLHQHGHLAMVGDGVNDAPALASATIGFAMGAAGTDVALETADVVLMSDDLGKLPQAIDLSRRARRIIHQNLVFAMSVMSLLVLSAVLGLLRLPLGVIGHEGSTVVVLMNGLRLLSNRLS